MFYSQHLPIYCKWIPQGGGNKDLKMEWKWGICKIILWLERNTNCDNPSTYSVTVDMYGKAKGRILYLFTWVNLPFYNMESNYCSSSDDLQSSDDYNNNLNFVQFYFFCLPPLKWGSSALPVVDMNNVSGYYRNAEW